MPCLAYALILDDNDLSLKIAFAMFSALNWCVIRCRTKDQALQAFLDNPNITLFLCDFILQDATGVDMVRSVREFEKESMSATSIPIIGFSSKPKARQDFLQAGGTGWYEKPLTRQNVLEIVPKYGPQ
ncbi:TPA_asm: RRTF [Powellomyces chytrid fungus MELD virus 3]|nr:TPA_asm: RRTF [Powellomyces chytrid fungus MELD virus 3]